MKARTSFQFNVFLALIDIVSLFGSRDLYCNSGKSVFTCQSTIKANNAFCFSVLIDSNNRTLRDSYIMFQYENRNRKNMNRTVTNTSSADRGTRTQQKQKP
ncbi:hypothetical protein LguiA_005336 [Lonicera macranthoides]